MNDRKATLRGIVVGDIFHADVFRAGAPGGRPSYNCLALQIRKRTIFARRVTTQSVHEFDRDTGIEIDDPKVVIDSVEPLPDDIREIMLGLDHKYRDIEFRQAEEPDWEPPPGSSRLTKDQIRAFSFIANFYPGNPLPPP